MYSSKMSWMKELKAVNRLFKKMRLVEKIKAEFVSEALEKKVVRLSQSKEIPMKAIKQRSICI